ncbi:MAG: hypothetical protein ACI4ET_12420 [Bilifractor sp.]
MNKPPLDRNRLFSLLHNMESDYHNILGLEGWHELAGNMAPMLLSLVNYKMVLEIADYSVLEIRPRWTWNFVKKDHDPYDALNNAIYGTNYANFVRLPYGTDWIYPLRQVSEEEKEWLGKVLVKWMERLEEVSFSEEAMTTEARIDLNTYLRGRINYR